jgi:FkbM family methyltransferase
MNWYIALSAATLASPHHDWPSLIRVAVRSATRCTSLVPHLLWDGPETGFLDELRGLGVRVMSHRVSFYDRLVGFKDDPAYLGTAAGCFLRVDIPVLEESEEFVLYTDADVVFLRDPVPALRTIRPEFFAAMSEFTFDDGLNSGVLLLNIRRMRQEYPAFRAFIEANLALGLDQDMYRHFYAGRWNRLPPGLNWKPYWGRAEEAVILHWHGIKPVLARTLLDNPAARVIPALQMLVDRNREGYRHYIRIYDDYLHSRRPRCAVVLVVKDEAADIAAWLAWYLEQGFDACLVYDDDSTDGTWEILQQAAKVQDIRPQRTIGPKPGRYEIRQEMCYRQALADGRDEFEWLAFFDADEFLALYEDDDIHAFLGRFGNADAVAVNWCNYGSSGHLLKPAAPAFEAYTWHGDERQPINRHVKSIVRPRKVGPVWRNVHCFDVPDERYRLANGAPLVWSETPGIIQNAPDWRVAKLMHYQCRSMEHFVERLKKRPELAAVPGIWQAGDVRDVRDERPARRGDAVRARMAALGAGAPMAAEVTEKLVFDIGMSEGNDTAFYLAKGFRVVGVEADVKMFLVLQDRFEAAIGDGRLTLYDRAASDQAGRIVEFFRHDRHQGLSGLSRGRAEFSEGSFTAYHVLTTDWQDLAGRHGVPHYLKLDIEGHEAAFLRGMKGAALPAFVSIECHEFAPVEVLAELGYRRFQLVDQNPPGGFRLPAEQREGRAVVWESWDHATGPFGDDLPDEGWVDFAEFSRRWQAVRPNCAHTWFDCHARLA